MVAMNNNNEPGLPSPETKLTTEQKIDYHMAVAGGLMFEVILEGKRFPLFHSVNHYKHKLIDQRTASAVFVYSGPYALEINDLISKAAKDFLTQKSGEFENDTTKQND